MNSPTPATQATVSTIFRDIMLPDFVVKIKEPVTTLAWPAVAEDYFYMMLSSKSDKLNKFYLQLSDGKVYMRNNPDSHVLAYIDIGYSRLKLIKSASVCGKTLHAIRFIKNRNYEEIFHADLATVQSWFKSLTKYCVLSKFREAYTIRQEIGRGNFAKVYVTRRAADNVDFATKIFDKKLILQDKFERVDSGDRRSAFSTNSR